LSLLDQSVDIIVGQPGGDDHRPRLTPPRDQLLFGLDGDRDPIIRTDPAPRQLGGRVARGGFDDLSLLRHRLAPHA
jgi:hypothetical protein